MHAFKYKKDKTMTTEQIKFFFKTGKISKSNHRKEKQDAKKILKKIKKLNKKLPKDTSVCS